MTIEELKDIFNEPDAEKAHQIISCLNSKELKVAVVSLSDGNINWLRKYVKLAKNKSSDLLEAYEQRRIEKKSVNDIWISDEEVIKWIEFDSEKCKVISIDNHILPIEKYLNQLQIICVSSCCGIKAFSFRKKDLERKIARKDTPKLILSINFIIEKINKIPEDVISSSFLNQHLHKSVFIQLMNHIKSNLTSS